MVSSEKINNIEPKEVKVLTPAKLARYYKIVGGNYDCKEPLNPVQFI